eukprot:6366813-Amphidinium_carterae.1
MAAASGWAVTMLSLRPDLQDSAAAAPRWQMVVAGVHVHAQRAVALTCCNHGVQGFGRLVAEQCHAKGWAVCGQT